MFAMAMPPSEGNLSGNYLNNRAPLLTKPYVELPIGAIKPEGWLEEQLLRMATGMTGHLDSVYVAVMGPRNGWLGGDGDVWERGPYWIDGLLPLAYILNDKALIDKVQPWIEWALASQKPNGYFGPDTDRPNEPGLQRGNSYDWWPKMVMLKVMQQYYSATGDERVISFLTNYFKYQLQELPKTPLGNWTFWGEQRGGDNLLVVYWLYNITGEEFLLELGELIHKQTLNWTDIFLNQDHLKRQHSLHCVNLAQGFKEPVIYYQQNKDAKQIQAVKKAVTDMRNTIAFPTGLWAGDELLRFGNPNLGSELCTAVEMMYSLEKMLEITGDVQWADHLERIAYNVLPTQITDDFSARQYYHQINQIAISRSWRDFVTPHEDTDNLHGVLTGYPCCTSNMHQGWPKLVQNLWYATADNGVAALVYAPSNATIKVANGTEVQLKEETAYPFEETINFTIRFVDKKVKKTFFPFHLRVPAWCKQPVVRLNGEVIPADVYRGEIVRINREWQQGDKLTLELPMHIEASYWFDHGAVIERGPLIYSLKMEEKWAKKSMEAEKIKNYGSWYYEVTSGSPWNYALTSRQLKPEAIDEHFKVEKSSIISRYPWTLEDAPIKIIGKGRQIPSWTMYRGSAGSVPFFTQQGPDTLPEETIELIPFGCTTLRITEFPVRN
ncbi:beta-L-arabinofuranosidase domain-containing protein [Massilibacteroides sp.]|uniref:beta-L-arabinofuranosidase domain-containing protein n=1 Tax=Massilibacteroides sp. TaxID=2034766 RepID=UPI002611806A|nr:beta-L-arabinofuranosidase domain-containing protein [Massilibacteroides sp.]MDD4515850.1 glycoside hydrolase family 127 protein [Massilibacteroides sp.]